MENSSSSPDPPFNETYRTLFKELVIPNNISYDHHHHHHRRHHNDGVFEVEECELPLIDLSKLNMGGLEREECKKQIAKASREWGFFQVLNHGISREILEKMRSEQVKIFKKPFHEKSNFLAGSYRWGTPSATCLNQLSWSEAFHVPLNAISSGLATHDFLR